MYGVLIRFWPTLEMDDFTKITVNHNEGLKHCSFRSQSRAPSFRLPALSATNALKEAKNNATVCVMSHSSHQARGNAQTATHWHS
jgi:hypothetical protein